ncbi:hypothetical protein QQS21_005211 [Conoideocrella luteorostrata]|uniref:Uncharacterized protein n=1 Tax=Conoideocrella luteorostrata TaxID=1105319 RepID=A0AAJ0G128_9HYPO|nr:hypothetical protein QQS21_005211 [Conoideocrella luteorostrata]
MPLPNILKPLRRLVRQEPKPPKRFYTGFSPCEAKDADCVIFAEEDMLSRGPLERLFLELASKGRDARSALRSNESVETRLKDVRRFAMDVIGQVRAAGCLRDSIWYRFNVDTTVELKRETYCLEAENWSGALAWLYTDLTYKTELWERAPWGNLRSYQAWYWIGMNDSADAPWYRPKGCALSIAQDWERWSPWQMECVTTWMCLQSVVLLGCASHLVLPATRTDPAEGTSNDWWTGLRDLVLSIVADAFTVRQQDQKQQQDRAQAQVKAPLDEDLPMPGASPPSYEEPPSYEAAVQFDNED